jgi:hypothetical protein
MAQKSQTATQPEDQANSGSRTSSAKDGAGAPSSARQSNSSGPIPSSILPPMSDPSPLSTSNSESPQPPPQPQSQPQSQPQPQPQPMEKPSAAGSQASPYGTRSRNRTGAARPNYAEDKDLDLDGFDAASQRKDDDAKKFTTKQPGASSTPAPPNSSSQPAARSGNGSLRKPLPDDSRQQNGTKELAQTQPPTAPSSAPVANGAASTANGTSKSKKRKVADSASTASGSQTPAASNGALSSSALQKRLGTSGQGSGNATPSDAGYGETNLLTFENSKSRPKDGKMVADDGTVLAVNGKFFAAFHTRPA